MQYKKAPSYLPILALSTLIPLSSCSPSSNNPLPTTLTNPDPTARQISPYEDDDDLYADVAGDSQQKPNQDAEKLQAANVTTEPPLQASAKIEPITSPHPYRKNSASENSDSVMPNLFHSHEDFRRDQRKLFRQRPLKARNNSRDCYMSIPPAPSEDGLQ